MSEDAEEDLSKYPPCLPVTDLSEKIWLCQVCRTQPATLTVDTEAERFFICEGCRPAEDPYVPGMYTTKVLGRRVEEIRPLQK